MNFFDRRGAEELLKRIQGYWAKRGYQVDGFVHDCGFHEKVRMSRYEVRTNLVNGLPAELAARAA